MLVQAVENGAVGCVDLRDTRHVGSDVPERGASNQKTAIRVCLGHDRREVAVTDRKQSGHRMVEGEVVALPVSHCSSARRLDEAHIRAVVPGNVRRIPCLRDTRVDLTARVRVVKRLYVATGWIRVVVERPSVWSECEPVPATQGAEVVVERVVLHHEHDDVLDLRHRVHAGRQMRVRTRSGREERSIRSKTYGHGRGRVVLAADDGSETGCGKAAGNGPGQGDRRENGCVHDACCFGSSVTGVR